MARKVTSAYAAYGPLDSPLHCKCYWWGLNPWFNFLMFSNDSCCMMKRCNANPHYELVSYQHIASSFQNHLSWNKNGGTNISWHASDMGHHVTFSHGLWEPMSAGVSKHVGQLLQKYYSGKDLEAPRCTNRRIFPSSAGDLFSQFLIAKLGRHL